MKRFRKQGGPWFSAVMACAALSGATAAIATQEGSRSVVIHCDANVPPIEFAARETQEAFRQAGFAVLQKSLGELSAEDTSLRIILTTRDRQSIVQRLFDEGGKPVPALEPQGYAVRLAGRTSYWVVGADNLGAMYGGLDMAEAVRLDGSLNSLSDKHHNPSIPRRGIKFNIPLDARTPSYDDTGDAAQHNYAEMWNFDFWREFLDDMARYRYNTLTLWNPHPFPSIVKLPDYPDVALNDVCITTLKPTYRGGAWRDPQFVSPEVLRSLRVVKRMTIDEKIEFWRRVMQHARDRGIDVYFITWNVLMNSAEGKYGITTDQDNPKTIAYLRQCLRETLLTYPLLAGIGVTAGENMRNRDDEFSREKWLWKTYGLGILDAKKEQPGRTVRFIHRVWQSGLGEIMREFGDKYPDPFEIGFKYARAHMYSSTKPPFAESLLTEMKKRGVKCWWNLRNDDIFNFRWGDPEYVRAFLSNLPPRELTAGYHMGSDGYVWGREFTSLEPETPRALEIKKHWYAFMLWGRLGYDLSLSRDFFEKTLFWRFPEAKDTPLYDAWFAASKIIPLVNRFHWRNWDFMWAVEGCMDQGKGFHTVRDFIDVPPMEGSGLISIPEYVERYLAEQPMTDMTPVAVAEELHRHAERSLNLVREIRDRTKEMSKELRLTLCDIEAMGHLGSYYASKILGATHLHTFEESGKQEHKRLAVQHLLEAQKHWEEYAEVASALYRPQLLARTRMLDWKGILEDVGKDVDIARRARARE